MQGKKGKKQRNPIKEERRGNWQRNLRKRGRQNQELNLLERKEGKAGRTQEKIIKKENVLRVKKNVRAESNLFRKVEKLPKKGGKNHVKQQTGRSVHLNS